MPNPTPRTAAAEYLKAVEAEKAVKAAKAQAAEALRAAYAKAGVDTIVVDDHKVALVPVTTTTVDVDTLFDVADEATFQTVTKVAVDLKKWHAAVKVGLIDPTLADKVVTEKVADRIEVDRL